MSLEVLKLGFRDSDRDLGPLRQSILGRDADRRSYALSDSLELQASAPPNVKYKLLFCGECRRRPTS